MSDDSFAALFEAQGKSAQGGKRKVRLGETIEAVVVQVGKDTVFVEFDGKQQAMMDRLELENEDGSIDLAAGDVVRAKVLSVEDATGVVRLGKTLGRATDLASFELARQSGAGIEGKVTGANKGGVEVDLGKGVRGFCPNSQLGPRGTEAKDLVGTTTTVAVTEIKDNGRSIVLSRRRLLENDAKETRDRALASLEKGQIVRGTVTAVREFGAFVDIGGIEALLPASELGHERGVVVADKIKAGETVEAQVLEIKEDGKKITLSLKSLMPAPERPAPKAAGPRAAIGSVVKGKVVRIETYGVFVQLVGTEGREGRGLVPSAELGVPRGTDLRKTFPEGTELTAKVLETGDGRLKLSVKGAKDAAERADFEAHKDIASAGKSLGTFADLLNKAKAKK
ncbi:30S ribosomal protein S1 [soil metagenome]